MIGKALRIIRKKRGLTQGQLADQSGITQTYLSQIEKNKKEPTLSVLRDICEVINVPVAILFWFTLDESKVEEGKREAFNLVKPSVDEMILSFFNTVPNV